MLLRRVSHLKKPFALATNATALGIFIALANATIVASGAETVPEQTGSESSCSISLVSESSAQDAIARLPKRQRFYLKALLEEKDTPARVRHALEVALNEHDLEILELTPELREKWNVGPREQAIASTADEPYKVFRQESMPLMDAASTLRTTFKRRYGIAVSDRPVTQKDNDLVRLVHELAHVAFEIEFRRNLKPFVSSLPRSLGYIGVDGTPWINEDFYTFLTEQYAHEIEFLALRYSFRRHFDVWLDKYATAGAKPTDEASFAQIASTLLGLYEIRDPMVKVLSQLPLDTLRAGHIELADQLERVLAAYPTLLSIDDSREFDLGIALARLSEGDTQAFDEAHSAFQAWIKRGLGGRRFTKVIEMILESLHQVGRSPSVLIEFLNQSEIRKSLSARGRWKLPDHFVSHVDGFLSAIPR